MFTFLESLDAAGGNLKHCIKVLDHAIDQMVESHKDGS
jgi:hypothetical protein